MRKIIEKIKNTVAKAKNAVSKIISKISRTLFRTKTVLAGNAGEGYVDTGIKIIIAVVIGGVLLAGLYALFNTTIIPTLTDKIADMFGYSG